MPDLQALLWPKAVAVVGASNDEASLRGRIVRVMTHHAFAGTIYPISRSEDQVQGLPATDQLAMCPNRSTSPF